MSKDALSLPEVEELLNDCVWLLLDDGEEICPGCVSDMKEYLLAEAARAIDSGHFSGWVVVGWINDDSPELSCCNCDRRDNFEEEPCT